MPTDEDRPASDWNFATTGWTMVFSAVDVNNQPAREEFARLYWFPLYAFARRRGNSPAAAEDAVQSFLGRILNDGSLGLMAQTGGRFRDVLRESFKNELTDAFRRDNTRKRRPPGGFVYIDAVDLEARFAMEPADSRTPEGAYDRLCARALLDAVADRLRHEDPAVGHPGLFSHLMDCLNSDPDREVHAAVAARLGLDEGSLRNMVPPFRRRFRVLFRQYVAATLSDSGRVDDEIRDLRAAVSK